MREITIPISDETIRSLKVGEPVLLSGVMMTGRDAVHKWMIETFVKKTREPQGDDLEVYEAIEGPLTDNQCLFDQRTCTNGRCILGTMLTDVSEQFYNYLNRTRLSELSGVFDRQEGGHQ